MCLLFCFVLFWILCCVVCEKNENKKLLITKKEIDFSSGEKRLFPICVFIETQYSLRISGNRGYDSNRVRFQIVQDVKIVLKS